MSTNAVFSGQGNEGFVELAFRPATPHKGRLFRKQILRWGDFPHPTAPGKSVHVDDQFADTLIRNFKDGVCDIVQAPLVDDKNRHSEDPTRNIGRVVDLEKDAKGVYAILDARKYAEDLGSTLIGASAMMSLDYEDTKQNKKKVGPTLLHMAVTNRPYLTDLDEYSEVVGLSAADTEGDEMVLLGAAKTSEENTMTKEEMLALLKAEHNIDVEALQVAAQSTASAEMTALSNVLGESGTDLTVNDVAEAVLELSQKATEQAEIIETLTKQNKALELAAAEEEIDGYIQAGRILPKQRERMLALSMNDRETFEDLLPDEALVSLSEEGVTTHQSTQSKSSETEAERYLASLKPSDN